MSNLEKVEPVVRTLTVDNGQPPNIEAEIKVDRMLLKALDELDSIIHGSDKDSTRIEGIKTLVYAGNYLTKRRQLNAPKTVKVVFDSSHQITRNEIPAEAEVVDILKNTDELNLLDD